MNGKFWPTLLAIVIAGQSTWLLSLEVRKAGKDLTENKWTGGQMIEYKAAQEIYQKLTAQERIEYKKVINKRFDIIERKIDILLNERGMDSRGSERE